MQTPEPRARGGWVAWLALEKTSAPVSLTLIAVSVAASWGLAWVLGGAGFIAPHWFYIPIFLAALRFGLPGAVVTAVISTVVAGPLLPADVASLTSQDPSDWISRGIFFILLGAFVAQLFAHVRTTLLRENSLIEGQRIREVQDKLTSESERRFRSLVQRATDMITVADVSGQIVYESPAAERILGWEATQRVGTPLSTHIHPDDIEAANAVFADVAAHPEEPQPIEIRQRDSRGDWHWIDATITNLVDEPTIHGLVINSRVVDDRKALEEQLTHRAFNDPLTKLANRTRFTDSVRAALRRRDVDTLLPSALFIDVDDFKTVNDGYGHDAGDDLLVEIGDRLLRCVRPDDVVARLGGDEFAILVAGNKTPAFIAVDVAERVLAAMGEPFSVAGHQVHMQVSVGIACHEKGGRDPDEFIRQADVAMYKAKADGKARYALFSDAMDDQLRRRIQVEAELRSALEKGEIAVHYQPIVRLADRRIVALEALVRWDHPTRGLLPPSEFLPTAEATGLIVPIGQFVLSEGCAQLRRWQTGYLGQEDLWLSVNVSSRQLRSTSLVADVQSAIDESGIEPRSLTIEVTETVLSQDIDRVAVVLEELRALGVRIAIDDFGTGYSSLSHLARFPVDFVKIDRSFVGGVCNGGSEAALVRGVLRITEELELVSIAEGVEDALHDLELRRLGCTYAQGYYYSRPAPAADIGDVLIHGNIAIGGAA
jgi:diguanylate cyclase (GGDEF)-like protein/PAS domain S-box-containing protein